MSRIAPPPGRPKARLTLARVDSVTRISPNFRRLRLRGDFTGWLGGALHFRLMLGPEGAGWPAQTDDGLDWPGGPEAWHRPPYTIRAMDPGGRWLDTDIFLHEGGRVTAWTEALRGGEEVGLTGPGGGGTVAAPWLGCVGDETALPVILRCIEALPADAWGEAHVCIPDPADAQPVATPPGFRLNWVTPGPGRTPLDLLCTLPIPALNRFVYFAGEKSQAEAARHWLTTRGLERAEFRAAAYWARD